MSDNVVLRSEALLRVVRAPAGNHMIVSAEDVADKSYSINTALCVFEYETFWEVTYTRLSVPVTDEELRDGDEQRDPVLYTGVRVFEKSNLASFCYAYPAQGTA